MTKASIRVAACVLAGLAVAGCGGSDGAGSRTGSSDGGSGPAVLSTADSDLGTVVVDGSGRTVYVFDKDTAGSGESACSGDCLEKWPAVTADSGSPEVDGVTGDVAAITRDDGTAHLTLDGRPLYTYAGDGDPGDVNGQGVGGVWWVVAPDGAAIKATPPPPEPSAY